MKFRKYRRYKPCELLSTDKVDIQAHYYMLHGIAPSKLLLLVPHDFENTTTLNQQYKTERYVLKNGVPLNMRRSCMVNEPIVIDLIKEVTVDEKGYMVFEPHYVGGERIVQSG